MTYSQLFLVFAVAVIAPHVNEVDAKLISLSCVAFSAVFFAIELWIGGKK